MLRRARERAGLSIVDAAMSMGMQATEYATLEAGLRRDVDWDDVFAAVLGTSKPVVACEAESRRGLAAGVDHFDRRSA